MSNTHRRIAFLGALTASLALELAPVRVNLIAAGFVDTPLSATLLGDALENRRSQLTVRRFAAPGPGRTLALAWRRGSALGAPLVRIAATMRKALQQLRTKN